MHPDPDSGGAYPAPLILHRERVRDEWLDINAHMNVAYYLLAFDHATDAFMELIGLDQAYTRATGGSIFVLEAHAAYLREVVGNDPLRFTTHLIDFDEKRIHAVHAMYHDEKQYHAATNELMLLHMDLGKRRAAPMPMSVRDRLAAIKRAHAGADLPPGLSRKIGFSRPPPPHRRTR